MSRVVELHRLTWVLVAGVWLGACRKPSGAPAPTPTPTIAPTVSGASEYSVWYRTGVTPVERTLPFSIDAVWAALPKAFADLGYQAGPASRAGTRMYFTPSMTIQGALYTGEPNSQYLDCGLTSSGMPAADTYGIQFAILARLTSVPYATRVEVVIDGTARARGQSSNAVFCSGTGRLEESLLLRITGHAAAAQ